MKILVIDSHNDQRPDARLPRLLAALGQFEVYAEGFRSVRRLPENDFHDLSAYDLALVHESDARLDNAAFFKMCVRAIRPCVLFSGGTGRAMQQSSRLLLISDTDLIAHAEAGIEFWRRTARLDLTAWTQGLQAACRAEIHRLCEPLRKLLRSGVAGVPADEIQALANIPEGLRVWCQSEEYQATVGRLSAILETMPWNESGTSAAWVEQHRDELSSLVRGAVFAGGN